MTIGGEGGFSVGRAVSDPDRPVPSQSGSMTRKPPSGHPDLFEAKQPVVPAPTLVGVAFCKGAREALGYLREVPGPAHLTLMREPLNPHDPNAIRVFADLMLLSAAQITTLMDGGAKPRYAHMLMLGYVDRITAARWASVLDAREGRASARVDLACVPPVLTLLYD
jgi:hypothetical protein